MPRDKDPTEAIREAAAAFEDVTSGTACNQTTFKVGKGGFLYIGPGAKGVGYKAMFRLGDSLPDAEALADEHPDRFEVGRGGMVTARFSAEKPLAKRLWKKWLRESYQKVKKPSGSAR